MDGKLELLSPAGDYDCFTAAVNAGADAVYLGLSKFGARANAANFTQDELLRALEVSHILGKKIYLTVNTLFRDSEIDELYDLLLGPYENGLYGVIVQDIGVMSYIHSVFPDLPIHVSTQAGITAADGAHFLKSLGVCRIVPARELSLREIRKLKDETGLEIECFIHGSMCYSYSGKCLLSSFIGGRSGNRGRCAQPCRLMYDDSYPLSLKDMCTIDILPELIRAGISSFKIEGRMKNSSYVYGVTKIYRKYIDKFIKNGVYDVDPSDRSQLISYYTRSGNCQGYYHCHNGKDMITPDSPSYESSVSNETDREIIRQPQIPVDIRCEIRSGQKIVISVSGGDECVEHVSEIVPDTAKKRPITPELVAEQIKKTGGSEFEASNIDVILDNDLFVPMGALNAVRRDGLNAFREKIISKYRRVCLPFERKPVTADKTVTGGICVQKQEDTPDINVGVLSRRQLDVAVSADIDGIVIPMSLFMRICEEKPYDFRGKKIYVSLPYVIRDENLVNSTGSVIGFVGNTSKEISIAGFYICNPESAQILKRCGYEGMIVSDIHLYAYNRETEQYLRHNGITKTTVPVELNRYELFERGITNEELIVYGRIPVMISANCIKSTEDKCEKSPSGHDMYIKDRKGEGLFVRCECDECTNIIYNSVVLDIADENEIIERLRPSSVRLSFTDESPEQMRRIIDTCIRQRDDHGPVSVKLADRYTRGHIKRGVK